MSDHLDQYVFDFQGAARPAPSAPVRFDAIVTPFPLARRRRKIVATSVTLLARRSQLARQNSWDRIVSGLASELRRHGASSQEIAQQLEQFRTAVAMEMAECMNDKRAG